MFSFYIHIYIYIDRVLSLCFDIDIHIDGWEGGHICHHFLLHSNNLLFFAILLKLMLKAVDMQLVQTDVLAPVLRVGI